MSLLDNPCRVCLKGTKEPKYKHISAENEENPPLLMEVGDFNSRDVVESHMKGYFRKESLGLGSMDMESMNKN